MLWLKLALLPKEEEHLVSSQMFLTFKLSVFKKTQTFLPEFQMFGVDVCPALVLRAARSLPRSPVSAKECLRDTDF